MTRTLIFLALSFVVMDGTRVGSVAGPRLTSAKDEIRITEITLPSGSRIGITFHPAALPATVRVATSERARVRVCAGDRFEIASSMDRSSWRAHWQEPLCRQLGRTGEVRLPRFSEHVSIMVLNVSAEVLHLPTITLHYSAHDPFNAVRLPLLAPGDSTAAVRIPNSLTGNGRATVFVSAAWEPSVPATLNVLRGSGTTLAEQLGNGSVTLLLGSGSITGRRTSSLRVQLRNDSTAAIEPTVWFSSD